MDSEVLLAREYWNAQYSRLEVFGMTTQAVAFEFMIKVRKRGTKTFAFLSSGGRINRLRIHACRYSDKSKAESAVKSIENDNPEYEAKVVQA